MKRFLFVFATVAVLYAEAGFLDGLKKVGAGLAESASGVVDATVTASTSTVSYVKAKGAGLSGMSQVEVAQTNSVIETGDKSGRQVADEPNQPRPNSRTEAESGEDAGQGDATVSEDELKAVEKKSGDYLMNEFLKAARDLLAKDVDGSRYGRGDARNKEVRNVYGCVCPQDNNLKWQSLHHESIESMRIYGDICVPRSLVEFGRWKKGIEENLDKERMYWKENDAKNKEALEKEHARQEAINAKVKVFDDFLTKTFRPQVAEMEKALRERYEGYKGTSWEHGVLPFNGINLLDRETVYGRLVDEFGDEFCEKWKGDLFGVSHNDENPGWVATRLLMEPWNDVAIHWNPTNVNERSTCMFFGVSGNFRGYDYYKSGRPIRFLDRNGTRCTEHEMKRWMEVAEVWLARTRKAVDRECFLDGYSLSWFAQAHNTTNYVPFQAYKTIVMGDSVGTIFRKLTNLNEKVVWQNDLGCRTYPNGKILSAKLKAHKLRLIFGALEENAGSALVSLQVTFNDVAPAKDAMIAKYMRLPEAKQRKQVKEIGRRWKEDDVSNFWRVFSEFSQAQLALSMGSETGEQGELSKKETKGQQLLLKDLEEMYRAHTEGIISEWIIIESRGMEITIMTGENPDKVTDVVIADSAMAELMEKKNIELKAASERRAKDAKSAAEKKRQEEAISF